MISRPANLAIPSLASRRTRRAAEQARLEIEALAAEERARIRTALGQLPDRQRAVLLLRHTGCSYAEVAAALDVAVGSVGVLLARAERALRQAYETTTTGGEEGDLR